MVGLNKDIGKRFGSLSSNELLHEQSAQSKPQRLRAIGIAAKPQS
jgi:hypothetical protein